MTGNSNKVRAVFLAALMIFSVFAGTVAFSGSAAAADDLTYDGNAVHYETQSNDGEAVIEVPFTGNVSDQSLTFQNFTVLDDGDNVTADVVADSTSADATYRKQNGSVIIRMDRVVPSNDLEVDISDEVRHHDTKDSNTGPLIDNPGEKTVAFAGQTIEHDTYPIGPGAPGSLTYSSGYELDNEDAKPNNITAYQGVTIAVNASNLTAHRQINDFAGVGGNVPVTVEGEDNNYFQEGSTGNNSTVFTFDTSDRELGQYKVYLNDSDNSGNRTYINIRDLDLGVEVDDLNVTTDDTIETTTSAVAGGREVNAELLDSGGDTINETSAALDGQGEADIDFNTATADDNSELETGTYTVLITDNATGVTVESSEIDVTQADDESAEFVGTTLTEQRGDILETTVELTETSEATINFGSPDDGVEANVTVEDDDDDDQVTVYINTYRMSSTYGGSGNIFNLDSDSDDNIVDQQVSTTTSDLIDAGDYDLEVEAGDVDGGPGSEAGVESSDDVATVTLEARNTENVRMWTGSADEIGSVSDLEDVNEALNEGTITQSSEVAVGDLAVHQIEVTGLEGLLNARDNEDVTTDFLNADGQPKGPNQEADPINLTIEEADPGANQDARELNLTSSNMTVIADGPNDTYFVVVDTSDVAFGHTGSFTPLPNDDDTALETNFTIVRNDAPNGNDFANSELDDDENEETLVTFNANEPDINVDEPFNVSQAEGQTVSGDTNIAPGTELSLRIRSDDGVSPSFLKTADPVVQSDGTYSATFDFSEQNVGDTYDIEVNSNTLPDGPVEEEGEVVEAVATDTATPEPDTDTATPEPDTDTATPEPDTDTATPEPDTDTAMPDTDTPTSTPTSTPGFGVIVALTALLAAALLAVRRDN